MIEEIVRTLISNYLDSQKGPLSIRLRQAITEWLNPVEPEPVPVISGWQPPQTPGLHCILVNHGSKRHYMSGLRIPDGLLLGDYGLHVGGAKIQRFDGTLYDEATMPDRESIYFFWMTPDGLPICTVEFYASILKRVASGKWEHRYTRPGQRELMFDPSQYGNEIIALRVNYAWGDAGTIVKGDANGNVWNDWKSYSNKRIMNLATDGNSVVMCGYNDRTISALFDANGNQIASRDENYVDQCYDYCISGNGNVNMAARSITEDHNHRNAYIDLYDGKNIFTVCDDLARPWIMDMQVDKATGFRYAVVSVWQETDHPTSQLLESRNNGYAWKEVTEIPMPMCLSMQIADGGIYLFGGKYEDYGAVYFWKF